MTVSPSDMVVNPMSAVGAEVLDHIPPDSDLWKGSDADDVVGVAESVQAGVEKIMAGIRVTHYDIAVGGRVRHRVRLSGGGIRSAALEVGNDEENHCSVRGFVRGLITRVMFTVIATKKFPAYFQANYVLSEAVTSVLRPEIQKLADSMVRPPPGPISDEAVKQTLINRSMADLRKKQSSMLRLKEFFRKNGQSYSEQDVLDAFRDAQAGTVLES